MTPEAMARFDADTALAEIASCRAAEAGRALDRDDLAPEDRAFLTAKRDRYDQLAKRLRETAEQARRETRARAGQESER